MAVSQYRQTTRSLLKTGLPPGISIQYQYIELNINIFHSISISISNRMKFQYQYEYQYLKAQYLNIITILRYQRPNSILNFEIYN